MTREQFLETGRGYIDGMYVCVRDHEKDMKHLSSQYFVMMAQYASNCYYTYVRWYDDSEMSLEDVREFAKSVAKVNGYAKYKILDLNTMTFVKD